MREPESLDEQALQEKGQQKRRELDAMLTKRLREQHDKHAASGVHYDNCRYCADPPEYQSSVEDKLLELFRQYDELMDKYEEEKQ